MADCSCGLQSMEPTPCGFLCPAVVFASLAGRSASVFAARGAGEGGGGVKCKIGPTRSKTKAPSVCSQSTVDL